MRARTELPVPPKPKRQPPHLFGRGLRDRLLMTLAVADRPLYVTELADALGSDLSKVRKAVNALKEVGILADSRCSAGARYIALNARHPAHLPLLRLLRVLEHHWPQPRFSKPWRKAERLGLRDSGYDRHDCLRTWTVSSTRRAAPGRSSLLRRWARPT
jgi:DNA-binding transcriptional ArsR family regulator